MDTNAELESLRKVHALLMEAVKTAESAVNAQLAQRRFWLEEICSNLDEEGNLQSTSIWKRPVTVKVPPGRKGGNLKRKKNSLESSSETKPAKKPRTKKKDSETTRIKSAAAKPSLKKGPSVKIKMRMLPVVTENRPPSPDSDATESQKDDDDEDDDVSSSGSYPVAQPSEHNSDSESAAESNSLDMMDQSTFGVHSAAYHPETRDVDEYQPVISRIAQHRPPQHHYAPHGVRTYTSLEDVVASDNDTDEDIF
ncbi:hypothetical protein FisN_22Lh190 [Fistulifera solaris]|uniref:Uncharacterized protein n=1 Tax=Fistulifera solaris TaxID=1519565 RepID=A0A1Z5JBY4_FISSO|nr:hypothetical protein FisN_22Lh190 [Fistulifera solaris]|eukprot:GAX11497.1 hypothetical protein FisN_22Lh190 [Fistulifera solaris]